MPKTIDLSVCRGVFRPCSNPVTNLMADPDGKGDPIPLCDEHWKFAMDLEKSLAGNQVFRDKFEEAVTKASIPSRYERKPVI